MKKKIILAVLLVVAVATGWHAYSQYQEFSQAEACYHKGDDLLIAGRTTAATEEFEKALAHYPEHLGAWIGLTQCHLDAGHWDLALAACDRALALYPRSAELYKMKAAAYRRKGDKAQEIANLETAARVDPSDPLVPRLLQRAKQAPVADKSPTEASPRTASPEPGK